jgi:hypothetical protein
MNLVAKHRQRSGLSLLVFPVLVRVLVRVLLIVIGLVAPPGVELAQNAP